MQNSDVDFSTADSAVQNAFLGRTALRMPLFAGTKLFKHTDRPLVHVDGRISPWWALVEPGNAADPGLAGEIARAESMGVAVAELARARFAVTNQWSSMSDLMVIELIVPAIGYYGRCAAQRMDETEARVVFIGGGWQVWIPNLTIASARIC